MKSWSMPRTCHKSPYGICCGLVGDPVKGKVLEKTNKLLKQMQSDQKPSSSQGSRRFNAVQFGNPAGNPLCSESFSVFGTRSAPNPRVCSTLCYFSVWLQ